MFANPNHNPSELQRGRWQYLVNFHCPLRLLVVFSSIKLIFHENSRTAVNEFRYFS